MTPLAVGRCRLAVPLAAGVGVLCAGAALGGLATTAVLLRTRGGLSADVGAALLAGGLVGLLLSGLAVLGAARLAASLRELRSYAVAGLDAGPGSLHAGRRTVATRELTELAKVVDALHLRVRVAEELGERHRREALTAGAGVFELVSGLVAAEEGARGQLAAELHDTVAQSLMIASGMLAAGPLTPERVEQLSDHVLDAEEQVRALMARTRPPALRDGDLASAVDGLRADLQARYALTVHVEWPAHAHPLPLASAVTVYRFFQEALLNVVKHADVDDAHLRLEVSADAVVATVRDEGPGFDPQAVRPDRGRHVGLSLLRERARLSGGTLEVDSTEGADTVLRLQLPRSGRGSGPVVLVAATAPAADPPVPLVAVAPAAGAQQVPLAC